jgi:hypothetical protein
MKIEILREIPISGKFSEKSFGTNFKSTLWVKFTTDDFQEWVGNFSRSSNKKDEVLADEKNGVCIVIAGGMPYAVNVSTKEEILEFEDYPFVESAIKTDNPNLFLLAKFYEIQVVNPALEIREYSPNFTVDGIYLLSQKDNVVLGHLYSPLLSQNKHVGFEFNLTTFQFKIDKSRMYKCDYEKNTFALEDPKKTKLFFEKIKNLFE